MMNTECDCCNPHAYHGSKEGAACVLMRKLSEINENSMEGEEIIKKYYEKRR